MNANSCDPVQDLLPELAAGDLDPEAAAEAKAHLEGCEACRGAYEVIGKVRTALPAVPEGLEERIKARVREEFGSEWKRPGLQGGDPGTAAGSLSPQVLPFRRRSRVPMVGLSAAAVLVLALGINLIWGGRQGDIMQDPVVVAAQDLPPEAWLWDDGMVAGAPVYDGLSDEDLEALLEDFEGGA